MLLADGHDATEWLLARYLDRLTEREADLIRAHYGLEGALTTRQIAGKHHISASTVLQLRHGAVRRLWRLIEWETDEPSGTKSHREVADAVGKVLDLTDDSLIGLPDLPEILDR